MSSATSNKSGGTRGTRVAEIEQQHFTLNGIEQGYFQQQKTGKTGSRLQKSKVLINTNKKQNQTNFCFP